MKTRPTFLEIGFTAARDHLLPAYLFDIKPQGNIVAGESSGLQLPCRK